jgi:tRNA uridine 5-carboxymethylaminomethyl modification enzyme
LLSDDRDRLLQTKLDGIAAGLADLERTRVTPNNSLNETLTALGHAPLTSPCTAFELLQRPTLDYAGVAGLLGLVRRDAAVEEQLSITARYDGYIRRQADEIRRMRGLEQARLPEDFDYRHVDGLSAEATEKLERTRPQSLGQVSRISGITPAAVAAIAVHLKRTGVS